MTALHVKNSTVEDGLFETSKFGNFWVNMERIGAATQSIEDSLPWKGGFVKKMVMISFGNSRHLFYQSNFFAPTTPK